MTHVGEALFFGLKDAHPHLERTALMGGLDGYVLVEAKIEVGRCQQMNVSKSLG